MTYKTYTIKKGKHYSGFHFHPTFKNSISYSGYFDASCYYLLPGEDRYDINKLVGLSTKWNHHVQSARVGWRTLDGVTMQLLPYCYVNSTRVVVEEPLATVKPGEVFTCTITDTEAAFTITVNGNQYTTAKAADKPLFNYILYPFVGGTTPAVQDCSVHLQRLV